jgi:carbamate kinase
MVGPVLSEWRARELTKTTKWRFVEDSGRGWRRVVPSPHPLDIVGIEAIASLVEAGCVVLAGGGGGVPLAVDAKGEFVGVEAVIDKDLTAALIADQLGAEVLILLTEVDNLYTHYGRPEQGTIEQVSAAELRSLADEGHFPAQSVGPKVDAALQFVDSGGQTAVITSAEKLAQALADRGGTRISLHARKTGVRHQLPLFGAEATAPNGALGDP